MKDNRKILYLFFKGNRKKIVTMGIVYILFITVFILYSLPSEPIRYAILLSTTFLFIIAVNEYASFYKKLQLLSRMKKSITMSSITFPMTNDLIERDYQEIIKIIEEDRAKIVTDKDKAYVEMLDYYTTWAHQIKTPIAAMRLLLQSQPTDEARDLLDQLFKIEQYVEMVLQYLRLEDMSSDLLIKSYPLDELVKQAIRKYSKSFIRKKIKLNYEQLNCNIITDEKWLVFTIEQVLSNALKYTIAGEISIYMDPKLSKTLVVEDTGIGIEKEDLPRIFEKGFTGFNGRLDKKSTGIGLYLCRRILLKLCHTIAIDSKIGQGTIVKIGLDSVDVNIE